MSKQRKHSVDWHVQLLEVVHSMSLATDLQSALTAFVDGAGRLVRCDGTSVLWSEGDHLRVAASRGTTAPVPGLDLPASQMRAARAVLDSCRAVTVVDTSDDVKWRPVPSEEEVGSWLGVPLQVDGRIIGLLEWTDRGRARFTCDDVEVAEELALHTSPVLYRAQLLDDMRRRLQELVEPQLATSAQPVDLGAELRQVVQEALESAGARNAFMFLLADEDGQLRCVAAAGEQRHRLRHVTLRGDGTLRGWPLPTALSFDWPTVGPSDREKMADLGVERALILPLRVGGEPVGMLGVAEPLRGRVFGQGAIRLMAHLASQASVTIERARRHNPQSTRYDYERVLQFSPLGIGVLTATGEIRVWNPALAVLLSRPDQNLTGNNLSEFLISGDERRLRTIIEEVAITGRRRHIEARVQTPSGEHRHLRMTLSFARVSGDAGGNLVAMVEDVTSLKILERERVHHLRELGEKHAQLQELDTLKSRFVSNVSHELRTPLAVIKLYATLARKGRPEKQTYYLSTIEQETHRLETMVENILDLTRLDRHTLSVHPELLSTKEIIAQVLEVYEETAKKREVVLENRVGDGLPPLWADKNHFVQMLTNLLDNALKYTPTGGQVWVAARGLGSTSQRMPTGGWLEISVGDQGVGVPEDEQEKIFERFYRGSNNSPGSTGTGLGLAIVRELMTQHGGTVTLESTPGKGSVFTLRFPLTPIGADNSAAAAADSRV